MTLFDDQSNEPQGLEDLVGEGKRYKTIEDLAKAAIEKDRFIDTLKQENAAAREELRAVTTLQNAADRLLTRQPDPAITKPEVNGVNEQAPEMLTRESVQEMYTKIKEQEVRQQKVDQSVAKLRETYGAGYQTVLTEATRQLGLSEAYVTDMAGQSPDALVALVRSVKPVTNSSPGIPQNTGGQTGIPAGVVKNQAYYRNLQKTDRSLFMSGKVQSEMHNEAVRQGDAFFN